MHDKAAHVFNIIESHSPWLYAREIMAISKAERQAERAQHPPLTQAFMALRGQPVAVGPFSFPIIVARLEQQGLVRKQELNRDNYIDLMKQRWGQSDEFEKRRTEFEADASMHWRARQRPPLYRHVYSVKEGGNFRRHPCVEQPRASGWGARLAIA